MEFISLVAILLVPIGSLVLHSAVTVLLFVAWRRTAMRGWLVLAISWLAGTLGGLPLLYGNWLLRRGTVAEYGRFIQQLVVPQTVLSIATMLLTAGGLLVLFVECRRL